MWLLIIFVLWGNAVHSQQAEFQNQAACQSALESLRKDAMGLRIVATCARRQ